MNRYTFMAMTGAVGLAASSAALVRRSLAATTGVSEATADYTVRIAAATYGGTVPIPLLRMHEGRQVTVDVHNDTGAEDVIHWHGQIVPPSVDGVIELGAPAVPAHGRRRYTFTPRPAGTRWYHSRVDMGPGAERRAFSGEFGFVLIEQRDDPGRYDREVRRAARVGRTAGRRPGPRLVECAITHAAGDGHGRRHDGLQRQWARFGPRRTDSGPRGRTRTAASAQRERYTDAPSCSSRAPLHRRCARRQSRADATHRGRDRARRGRGVDAIVEMTRPGVWVLGSTTDTFRSRGLGVVVEYAGQRGEPVWHAPEALQPWQYTSFAHPSSLPEPDGRLELVLRQAMGARNGWTINGLASPDGKPLAVERGKRYRLAFSNMSMMEHPMHLHGHYLRACRDRRRADERRAQRRRGRAPDDGASRS